MAVFDLSPDTTARLLAAGTPQNWDQRIDRAIKAAFDDNKLRNPDTSDWDDWPEEDQEDFRLTVKAAVAGHEAILAAQRIADAATIARLRDDVALLTKQRNAAEITVETFRKANRTNLDRIAAFERVLASPEGSAK